MRNLYDFFPEARQISLKLANFLNRNLTTWDENPWQPCLLGLPDGEPAHELSQQEQGLAQAVGLTVTLTKPNGDTVTTYYPRHTIIAMLSAYCRDGTIESKEYCDRLNEEFPEAMKPILN